MSSLERPTNNKLLTGVCAGIAQQFGWNVNLVRLVTVAVGFATGVWPAVIAYLIAWAVIPEAGTGKLGMDTLKKTYAQTVKPTVDKTFASARGGSSSSPMSAPTATAAPTAEWEKPYGSPEAPKVDSYDEFTTSGSNDTDPFDLDEHRKQS